MIPSRGFVCVVLLCAASLPNTWARKPDTVATTAVEVGAVGKFRYVDPHTPADSAAPTPPRQAARGGLMRSEPRGGAPAQAAERADSPGTVKVDDDDRDAFPEVVVRDGPGDRAAGPEIEVASASMLEGGDYPNPNFNVTYPSPSFNVNAIGDVVKEEDTKTAAGDASQESNGSVPPAELGVPLEQQPRVENNVRNDMGTKGPAAVGGEVIFRSPEVVSPAATVSIDTATKWEDPAWGMPVRMDAVNGWVVGHPGAAALEGPAGPQRPRTALFLMTCGMMAPIAGVVIGINVVGSKLLQK